MWGNPWRFESSPRHIFVILYFMMKRIIRPFQRILLERRLCVGCMHPLDEAKKLGNLSENRHMLECKCKRRYVYNKELDTFERATFAEEQQILNQLEKEKYQ